LLNYSHSSVKNEKLIVEYNKAPHHPEIQTYPPYYFLENEILLLKKLRLTEFINETKFL
jgi:hypothetical protein